MFLILIVEHEYYANYTMNNDKKRWPYEIVPWKKRPGRVYVSGVDKALKYLK